MNKNLLFSTSVELIRIPADAVVYIKADGNYSSVATADGSKFVLTMQLGQIERHIAAIVDDGDNLFIRIGKSLIVNREMISVINPVRQKLTLSDCRTFHYDLTASREALKVLKDYIEKYA